MCVRPIARSDLTLPQRAILDMGVTGIALFFAALLQMSEAILREDRPDMSSDGLSIAAALFLAVSNLK